LIGKKGREKLKIVKIEEIGDKRQIRKTKQSEQIKPVKFQRKD